MAAWIERIAGGRIREFGELLAHHYVEAHDAERGSSQGDPARVAALRRRAFDALLAAGDEARNRAAIRRAFDLTDQALAIADDPIERARALEARGHVALNDYRGDDAWDAFREAADLRLAHAPQDHDAIAYACARAVESPMRWPGSMRAWPDDDVVLRYLELGLAHASQEPNETLVRLLTAQAFRPFGLATTRPDASDRRAHDDAVAAGLRAADLALSIGRTDLASAALDGAISAPIDLGLYGEARPTIERRLALVADIDDPWERGDIYAMAAWEAAMLGEPRTALRHAEAGCALLEEQGAEGVALHSAAWGAFAEFQLGEWDAALERLALCRRLLGDRADDPPYFAAQAFCSAAMIHRLRDEAAEVERLRPIIGKLLGDVATHHGQGSARAWTAWIAIRDGRFRDADELLAAARRLTTRTQRPLVESIAAELLAASERWDAVPAFLAETRAYAAEGRLLALPLHLDRLEARAAAARGDLEAAAARLAGAAAGFAELEIVWEAARCELEVAEAAAALGRDGAARAALGRAAPVFERLRSRAELTRCRSVGARLA